MSEEHNHGDEYTGPFAFFLGPTKEQREHARMVSESNGHEMRNFFFSLTEEQLIVLMNVISNTIGSDGAAGSYYQGLITIILETKYGKCMGCGKDHDAELHRMVAPKENVAEPEQAPLPTFPAKNTAQYNDLMSLYGMEEDDGGTDNVMCKNCGKWYPNLQDRTLRAADKSGCPGCVHKEKFG